MAPSDLLSKAAEGLHLQGLKEDAGKMVRTLTHETESEAHQIFRNFPGHADKSKVTQGHVVPGIEHPGSTGVMYVSSPIFPPAPLRSRWLTERCIAYG